MARCVCDGFFPAFQAMTASTANSGNVCSHARTASARPCEMRNSAASAPRAMTKAARTMLGRGQSAAQRNGFVMIIRSLMKTTSRQNAWFKRVREAIREHADEIVIEGPKAVADALARGWTPIAIVRRGLDAAESEREFAFARSEE